VTLFPTEMRCAIKLQVVSVQGMNDCAVQNTVHHFCLSFHKSCIHWWSLLPPWRWPRIMAETCYSNN